MRHTIFLILLSLPLAACGGAKTPQICPQTAVVRDLAQIADFAREEKPDISNLVAAGKIDAIESQCSFEKDSIEMAIEAHILARRGPGLGGNEVEFPYFAALLGANDSPVAKQNMSARFRFGSKEERAEVTEKLRIVVPTPPASGGQWRVLLGFQLSPEQLAFNRNERGEPMPTASPAAPVMQSGAP